MSEKIGVMLALSLLLVSVAGCEKAPESGGPQYTAQPSRHGVLIYRLAVVPWRNPQKMLEIYQPLVDHLNRQVPEARFEFEAARDYPTYETKLRTREAELQMPNPLQTLMAMKFGYSVIATAGDPEDMKGILVVRRDSGIRQATDLKGRSVSCPSPTALAACIMPQYLLHRRGIRLGRDVEFQYVGSMESSLMNAYLKRTAAAAVWPPAWRAFRKSQPREAAELQVIAETPHLINMSVMVRDDLPAAARAHILRALLALSDTSQGIAILAGMETVRFRPAGDADYAVVRDYVARFEKEVRPVEVP